MNITIVANPRADHQRTAGGAMEAGLRRHGHRVSVVPNMADAGSETVICWGWRNARQVLGQGRTQRVLVMERGYIGDRYSWYSLGWGGLNGRARFRIIDDGGTRWREHFSGLLRGKLRGLGQYVLVLGQVRGDASLGGCPDLKAWLRRQAEVFSTMYGLPVRFRPHPVELERYRRAQSDIGLPMISGTLSDALSDAACAVAWNSNSLVDAALAGVPVFVGDHGSMAWPIHGQGPHGGSWRKSNPVMRDYRLPWAHRLAWTQWQLEEIESGAAWDVVETAMPDSVPAWSDEANWCSDAAA